MIKSNEEKANEFLKYIAENEIELKNNLKKNITYNEEIFNDSYQDTIIKIYNSIIKNGTEVKDFKQYFYISSKWTYILNYNRNMDYKKIQVRNYFDNGDLSNEEEIEKKERDDKLKIIVKKLKNILKENFNEEETNIFINYYIKRIKGRYSYKQLSIDNNISITDATNLIRKIQGFIKTNEEIKELKKLI